MKQYLRSTESLDYDHPEMQLWLSQLPHITDQKAQAILLYETIRDASLYDPYHLDLRPEKLKASVVLGKSRAWCVEKALLLAAAARHFEIPSRLGYGIVINHLGAEKLEQYLRKKEIVFHGYTELYIHDRWVKCTPAFDQRVCRLNGVEVLHWDGETDSLFQADSARGRFMEYLHFYGSFDDVPIELMNKEMKKHYPHLFEREWNDREFSFHHI